MASVSMKMHRHRTKDWPQTVWRCPVCTWRYLRSCFSAWRRLPDHPHRIGTMTIWCNDRECVRIEKMREAFLSARRKLAQQQRQMLKSEKLDAELFDWRSD